MGRQITDYNTQSIMMGQSRRSIICLYSPASVLFLLLSFMQDELGAVLLVLLVRAEDLVPPGEGGGVVAHKVVVVEVVELRP